MEIGFKFDGIETLVTRINGISERLNNITPIAPRIRDAFWLHEKQYLLSCGFGTFAPLKTGTLKNKKRGSDPRPFYGSSHPMVDSLTGQGPYTYYRATSTEVEVGVSTGPAHWHMAERKYMKARPPIKIMPELVNKVAAVMGEYVFKGKA